MTSLQEQLDSIPDLVDFFYNDTAAPHAKHSDRLTPVPPEFTTWQNEQRGWRQTAVLFDQSHHMPELLLSGPDAAGLLEHLGINSFANFDTNRAKQYVTCSSRGRMIGDCVVYRHSEEDFELVSGMTLQNWVHYNAEGGDWNVSVTRDYHTAMNPTGRSKFRFGMDGPNARVTLMDAVEGPLPEIGFFRTATVRIAGVEVLALGHGMAGHFGVELSGPYADGEKVRDALLKAGKPYGLRRGGTRAYFSAAFESAWIAYPLPAIYTDDEFRGFREWLPADGWEASQQLGGSFRSANIEDWYSTPHELGYGHLIKFDHDFIGRQALEQVDTAAERVKVSLVWDPADVARVYDSMFTGDGDELRFKYMALPTASYSFQQADAVLQGDAVVGVASSTGYTVNEAAMWSLAVVSPKLSEPGTRLELLWGEPDGGSRKSHVEPHRQTRVKVTVAPAPIARAVLEYKQTAKA